MKTYILTTVIFLALFNASLFSQTKNDSINKENFSIGAGIGYSTGYGISFRYTPNKFGIQANFSPMYNENATRFSTGVTFLYTLKKAEKTSFYLYQGNHYNYYKSNYNNNYYNQNNNDVVHRFNNGIGFGIEFIILQRIGFNIMGGYAFYDNFQRIGFTGEGGLYYKF